MKTFPLWPLKVTLLITLLFLWNVPQTIQELDYTQAEDLSAADVRDAMLHIQAATEQILTERIQEVERGSSYGPQKYFRDLFIVDSISKTFGLGRFSFNQALGELQHMMMSNVRQYSQYEVDHARNVEYKNKVDPGWQERESAAEEISWASVGNWLFGKYLTALPIAFCWVFLLFLGRYRQEKKVAYRDAEGVPFRFNYFSFFLLFVLWPIFAAYFFWVSTREKIAEAEIRRRKESVYTMLSKQEVALIRQFARSGKRLSQFQRELVGHGYHVPQRSLLFSLCITVAISLFSPWEQRMYSQEGRDQRTVIYAVSQQYDYSAIDEEYSFTDGCVDLVLGVHIPVLVRTWEQTIHMMRSGNWLRPIEHVPKYCFVF